MFVVIFGRPACSFCMRAKALAEHLKETFDDFDYRYVDMYLEGMSKAELADMIGKPVGTVPQVFVDDEHIGGYTEFSSYARECLGVCL